MGVPLVDGEVLGEQKVNDYLNHTLIAPVAYSPTVGAAAATAVGSFVRIGKRVEVEFQITFTGAGSGGAIILSTPSQMTNTAALGIGSALAIDGGATSTRRSLTVVPAGSTSVAFNVDSLATNALLTNNVPWTWAAGDTIAGRFSYWEV